MALTVYAAAEQIAAAAAVADDDVHCDDDYDVHSVVLDVLLVVHSFCDYADLLMAASVV